MLRLYRTLLQQLYLLSHIIQVPLEYPSINPLEINTPCQRVTSEWLCCVDKKQKERRALYYCMPDCKIPFAQFSKQTFVIPNCYNFRFNYSYKLRFDKYVDKV